MVNGQNNLSQQGMIHVNEYTRNDGVQVDEHWRARNGNSITNVSGSSGITENTPEVDPEQEEQKRKELQKAFGESINETINLAISLIPNSAVKDTLNMINNIGAELKNEDFEGVVVDDPQSTETTGQVMHLKDSFEQYSTKVDELKKQTIPKDNVNAVVGTATNALVGGSYNLSKIVERQDPEQKQDVIDAAQKAIRSLLGLASNAKKEVVKTMQNTENQNPEEKNTSMQTYQNLTALEDATYRYDNLLGAGLFKDAESEASRLFELSKTFLS